MDDTHIQSDSLEVRPLRGIITACNAKGLSHDITTLRKWTRLNSILYKTDRIDVRLSARQATCWKPLADFAAADGNRLSLRAALGSRPEELTGILDDTVHDVCLESLGVDVAMLRDWFSLLEERQLSARVLLLATEALSGDLEALTEALQHARAVTIAAYDPFMVVTSKTTTNKTGLIIKHMNNLTRALTARNMDVSLYGLPFCHVEEDNMPLALNSSQFFLDHGQYHRESYQFAERMYRFGSCRVSTAVENLLARKTSVHNLIDAALFPWIQDYPRLFIRVWMYHKLTRLLPFMRQKPRPLPEDVTMLDQELEKYRKKQKRSAGPVCMHCKYRMVCDHDTPAFRAAFPGIEVVAHPGDAILAAPVQIYPRKRYYDELDEARRRLPQRTLELAESTRQMLMRTPPTREISADTYDIVGRYTHHMPGAIRWLSFGKQELESTILGRVEPPFALSFTLGGGIATHAGFSFGRYAKIICPLIDYSHRLTLRVDADGYYVLLRDGQIVRPTEFEAASHVPPRLGGVLHPRISLHNIDGMILTQTVMLWEGTEHPHETMAGVKYSVIIISTRYTRRLQAALLALAHQQGIPRHLLEVVVGYVPGIDATDDLLDSIETAFPDMRVVRSPFAEGRARAKGFMINESLQSCSGKWVLLMDADIILPPDTFAVLDTVEDGKHFIAPEGRKMLPPDITGQILLNEIRPWEKFQDIMDGPGELRVREADDTPIGFFQCVCREILEKIPYHELDHFESSDWLFGRAVAKTYGGEFRLKDFYVLHLDHGGSQWYGTHKHR